MSETNKKPKILNFGSMNIDYVYKVDHFVQGGETLSSSGLELFCGGKGLNQSVALSKAGSSVYHAGIVGNDGQMLLDMLQAGGVKADFVFQEMSERNGHALIQIDKAGQNCILLYGGTNQMITKEMVDQVLMSFEEGDWLLLQNEINQLSYIMKQAHAKKMKIALNPSPMDEKIKGLPLEYVDVFLLNEIEASQIIQNVNPIFAQEKMSKDQLVEACLEAMSKQFPQAGVVLTLGKEGCVYKKQEIKHKYGIFPFPVVDTTGAGDTFTGFFLTCLLENKSIPECLKIASMASSIAVSKAGAATSIPNLKEVLVALEKPEFS